MRIPLQSDTATIVLVGVFQPQIFHPLWFGEQGALSKAEAEQATVTVVHAEIAHFTTAKFWVHVEPNRFMVASLQYPEAPLDFVMSVFGGALAAMPVNALGINRSVHFDTGSTRAQHALGRKLAPLGPWGEWGANLEKLEHDSPKRGGLVSLQMQAPRQSGAAGYTNVKVEPSNVVRNTGIFVEVNNHYSADEKLKDGASMVELLRSEWPNAIRDSIEIIEQLMKEVGDE